MNKLLFLLFIGTTMFFSSCKNKTNNYDADVNRLAEKYVRLGLEIGQYDPAFVDAYYGPDSLKPVSKKDSLLPKDSLLKAVNNLIDSFHVLTDKKEVPHSLQKRITWISKQLIAFKQRIKIFSGEFQDFDSESAELFSVKAPVYNETHFKSIVSQLDSILPPGSTIPERVQALSKKFIIPKDKLDTVFKTAIAEAQRRTKKFIPLPENESFTLEYVTGKTWSGYNWYKGNYKSIIQINTDLPIQIERAIDLGCHEGYPGHHVYNMLLEKNLYHDKSWVEISLYPLYSPQSFIAEGTANHGIEMAFPGEEKNIYCKNVLLPLAGLDTIGIGIYLKVIELKNALNYVRNEVARGILNKTMSEQEAIRWLTEYGLMSAESAKKSIGFIQSNRSYVICYNYGKDMVKNYIDTRGTTPEKRWELFGWILKNPVTPEELIKK